LTTKDTNINTKGTNPAPSARSGPGGDRSLLRRREFLQWACLACGGAAILGQDQPPPGGAGVDLSGLKFKSEEPFAPVEARFWETMGDRKIRCRLCPHECQVADQERGTCGVRENQGGKYYTLVHSRVCAAHVDPIEKKPLFHYLPGTTAFSLATPGCNMECQYCQNWQISQFRPEQIDCLNLPLAGAVSIARRESAPTIAFTYSEPVVYYEYMYDVAAAARQAGFGSVMISNGYIQAEPLRKLIPVLSAIKVDFKGFSEDFYSRICRGKLKPVLDALTVMRSSGIWLELVMLVVPTLNDSLAQNKEMFAWIRRNLGDQVPLHLTRFHPTYKLTNLPATPVGTLEKLHAEARQAGLKYVYVGNVYGHSTESTVCPSCGKVVIQRVGFQVVRNDVRKGRCAHCQAVIAGVFKG